MSSQDKRPASGTQSSDAVEISENLKDSDRPSIAAPIKSSEEQLSAHRAAHASDITLSDSSLRTVGQSAFEPLMLIDRDKDGAVQTLASSEAPKSLLELKALEAEAELNPALEPVVELKKFARTLPVGQEKEDFYRLAQDLAKSLRQKELSQLSGESCYTDACDSLKAITPDFKLSATAYVQADESSDFDFQKLSDFARIASERACTFWTDGKQASQFIADEQEKFIGIGEGLNEAKENVKALARAGWENFNNGTVYEILCRPIKINLDLETVLVTSLALGALTLKTMQEAPGAIKQASQKYDQMTPRRQGRVIGNAMFDFISMDVAAEFPELFAKSIQRSDKAIETILESLVRASKGNIDKLKASIEVARDFVSSDECRRLIAKALEEILGESKRPIPALADGILDSKLFMAGDESWKNKFGKIWSGSHSERLLTEAELKGKAADEAKKIILDKIVKEIDTSKLDDLVIEHQNRCIAALRDTIPLDDLITLYLNNHKFHFPDKLEDIFPELAKKWAEIPKRNTSCNSLFGIYFRELKTAVVSNRAYHESLHDYLSYEGIIDIAGVLRHEVAQGLEEIYEWKSAKHIHESVAKKIRESGDKAIIKQLEFHIEPGGTGWEQTISDLYASINGGMAEKEIELLLKKHFKTLLDAMENYDWFRKTQ